MEYTDLDAAIDRYVTMGPDEYFGYERENNYDDYNYDDDYNPNNSGLSKKDIDKLVSLDFYKNGNIEL